MPIDFPATIGIVLHWGAWYGGDMSQIYGRPERIAVREARHGEWLARGMVYFAPSDQHMEFQKTHIALSRGSKVHFARPCIDRLFFSAGRTLGRRVAGVLLTGANPDGAEGLACIKACGGDTFVQRPEEAAYPTMPLSGLKEDAPVPVPARGLPALLMALATGDLARASAWRGLASVRGRVAWWKHCSAGGLRVCRVETKRMLRG